MRTVVVPAERLARWLTGFADRHGPTSVVVSPTEVQLLGTDEAQAWIAVPFPPLVAPDGAGALGPELIDALTAHTGRRRTVGVLLARRRAHAVGVFDGVDLLASKVDTNYVQGTTKAGGWSQQRYARRRANQAHQAYAEAADVAATLLLPHVGALVAVVGGGDSPGVQAVLADPRLAPVQALLQPRVLPTPDPRLRVLQAFGDQLREVRITLNALA
jgi:hypothetical protein